MDSGNSGSLQSSSGGSEEYDSRVESISAFFNHNPLSHIGHGPLGNQPPPLPMLQQPQSHSSSTMFDPLSYLDHHPLSRSLQLSTTGNPSSVLNLDATWSKNLRSELNCTDLSGFMAATSTAPATQQLVTNQQAQSRATFPLLQAPQGPASSNQCSVSATNSKLNNKSNTVRNPKKRSRASRRAPTTVLTTDTDNFRAMVQECTGIPAPPFASSLFPRTSLDLFGSPSSTLRSTHLDLSPAPHYLLRPFTQKISPPPFLSSSMADTVVSNPSTNNSSSSSSSNTSCSSTSINHQVLLSSELGHLKQPQNLLNINMQNPILNFQSLLQTPPKYPLSGSNILGTKSHESSDVPPNEYSLKMGALEEFGLSQSHVHTSLTELQNMVSSQEHDQSLQSSMNGFCYSNNQRVSNGKVSNLSSPPSEFHADKGTEHVASRSEGMEESWICSSD